MRIFGIFGTVLSDDSAPVMPAPITGEEIDTLRAKREAADRATLEDYIRRTFGLEPESYMWRGSEAIIHGKGVTLCSYGGMKVWTSLGGLNLAVGDRRRALELLAL